MPKRSTLKPQILLLWILLQPLFTLSQDSTYTLPLWRAWLVVQDALKKHVYDTLIDSLENKIIFLEVRNKEIDTNYRSLLKIKSEESEKNLDIAKLELSMKQYYKHQARKFKRQRNVAYLIAGAAVSYMIFKPP